jgi:hypothetical protein
MASVFGPGIFQIDTLPYKTIYHFFYNSRMGSDLKHLVFLSGIVEAGEFSNNIQSLTKKHPKSCRIYKNSLLHQHPQKFICFQACKESPNICRSL